MSNSNKKTFDKQAYKEAMLEAVIDPPEDWAVRQIGGQMFVWYEGKWKWPTTEETRKWAYIMMNPLD